MPQRSLYRQKKLQLTFWRSSPLTMDESLARRASATSHSGQASEAIVSGTLYTEQGPASAIPTETGWAPPDYKSRLLSYDIIVTWNTLRVTFGRWQDRLMAAIMLVAAFAVTRLWFNTQDWTTAGWAALLANIMLAFGAGRLTHARLTFHASDGLLAVEALISRERRRYIAAWHGIALTLLIVLTTLLRPSLLVVSLIGYLAGAVAAHLANELGAWRRIARGRPGWSILPWSNRQSTGLAAAAILLLILVGVRSSRTAEQMALAGMGTILLALALSRVDDQVIRFMAFAGHGTRRIVTHHAKGLASFFAVAVPGSCILLGLTGMAIVAALSSTMLLLLTLRTLAYRLHERRTADVLVSLLAGLLMLAAYWVPPALPVIAFAMLWQFHRRGRELTWLVE